MRFSSRTSHLGVSAGFTLVEVMIIAPIVILMIGGFVGLMVAMTGDVLVTRDQNNMTYETQDALDMIERDTRLSTQFLVTSGTFPAPQGSDQNFTGTAAFTNTNSTLILGGLTTDKNPADTTRQLVYYANQPNDCGPQQTYNRVFQAKIMYFLKDGSLWRRSVLPDYNTNAVVNDDTVCAAPWQRNTCSPGYSGGTRCQTNDSKVMENVDSFTIKYFQAPGSTTDIGNAQALSATTIEVALSGKKVTAGRDITSSGTIRATKLNNIDVDLPLPATPTVTAQPNGSSVVFTWDKIPTATSYRITYNINGGTPVTATTDSRTTTYAVNAYRTDTVSIEVKAHNSTGDSAAGTAAATVPGWYMCGLGSNWTDYGHGYTTNGYTKTNNDIVILKGVIKDGDGTEALLCTLPAGYRPTARLTFQVASNDNTARVDILPSGEIYIIRADPGWLTLDGINFVASTATYPWTDITPVPNWTNYGSGYATLQSSLDPSGRTHIQGLVKGGSYAAGADVGIVPIAHRPSQYLHFPALSNVNFNFVGIGSEIDAMGINDGGYYSVQAMFYAASFNSWNLLSPQSGWVQFDAGGHATPAYTKSGDGIVTIKGLIKGGNQGTLIATLPPGYRPKETVVIHVPAHGAYGRIDILSDGRIFATNSHSGWTSLTPISFIAEQ